MRSEAASRSGKALDDCFFSVPSPGTLALFCKDCPPPRWCRRCTFGRHLALFHLFAGFFQRHDAYVGALAEALAMEYAEIARHGLLLQASS